MYPSRANFKIRNSSSGDRDSPFRWLLRSTHKRWRPKLAVIGGRGGNATECVVGTVSVQEKRRPSLTLRILATAFGLAVRGNEDPFYGATTDVIDPSFDSAQTRSEGIPLNS